MNGHPRMDEKHRSSVALEISRWFVVEWLGVSGASRVDPSAPQSVRLYTGKVRTCSAVFFCNQGQFSLNFLLFPSNFSTVGGSGVFGFRVGFVAWSASNHSLLKTIIWLLASWNSTKIHVKCQALVRWWSVNHFGYRLKWFWCFLT